MARMPDPIPGLIKRIAALEAAVKRLLNSTPFFGTGMHPTGDGGMQSDDFDGDLAAGNAGTKGWALNNVRAAFGELILRPGSVGNDSLTSPVIQSVARNRTTGFGLSNTAYVELAGVDIVVPALCSQVQANINASIFAYNPNTTGGSDGTGSDAFHIIAALGGQSTDDEPLGVSGSGGYATVRTADTFIATGLTPGQVIRLSVYGASAYASIAANAGNNAKVSAGLSFLR